MRLTLTASSHPELEPIRLTEGVLPIGRNDEPFASFPRALSAQLSARHARVFFEQDNFYISDLGSRNGSRLNGKPVHAEPKLIRAGDVLTNLEGNALAESGQPKLARSRRKKQKPSASTSEQPMLFEL